MLPNSTKGTLMAFTIPTNEALHKLGGYRQYHLDEFQPQSKC